METGDVGGHGEDAMLAEEADGFAVGAGGAAFADALECCVVGAFHAEEEACDAGLFVEGEEVGIADDVIGAGGADQSEGDVFGDEGFEEGFPGVAIGGGVFVGEVDDIDSVLAVEPGEFPGEAGRVTVAPSGPEAALAAVAAVVGATAGELDHDSAFVAPVGVLGEVEQFPADPVVIEMVDGRGGRGGDGVAGGVAESDALDLVQGCVQGPGLDELGCGDFPFASDDHVDLGFLLKDVFPVVGGEDPAVDDADVGLGLAEGAGDFADHGVGRGGAGVSDEDGIGLASGDFADDFSGGERGDVGIEEFDCVAGIEEGAADTEQAEWGEVFLGDTAADGGVGWVEEEDFHGWVALTLRGKVKDNGGCVVFKYFCSGVCWYG